jgi:glycosyltransferase involved in cell wall biosynthesis
MSGNYNVERTIKSVLCQKYKNIEYIVVDGQSKDRTLDIIRKYSEIGFNGKKISFWVSEKDSGMYDALNKGIKLAKGDIICCLNSDDFFYNENVINEIVNVFNTSKGVELVYSDILKADSRIKSGNNAFLLKSPDFSIENLKKGIQIYHPAAFISKKALIAVGCFNLAYKSAADLDLFCKLSKKGIKSKYISIISTVFLEGGLSSNEKSHLEAISVVRKHFGLFYSIPLYVRHYISRVYWLILRVICLENYFENKKISKRISDYNFTVPLKL